MPSSTNEFSFVACPTRLGQIVKTGPVTGERWAITPQGVWIDADDAAELVDVIEDIWCFRANRYLPMQTVFYMTPDANQMARRP